MGEAANNSDRSALSQPFVLGSNSQSSSLPIAGSATTVIGSGATIDGELKTENDLIVAGTVNGSVSVSGTITIAASGRINGNVTGTVIIFAGSIEGNLVATSNLVILSTARVVGDVETVKLVVEPGALIRGRCSMSAAELAED